MHKDIGLCHHLLLYVWAYMYIEVFFVLKSVCHFTKISIPYHCCFFLLSMFLLEFYSVRMAGSPVAVTATTCRADVHGLSFTLGIHEMGGDPGVVVSIAAFHAGVRGSFPGLGGLKETKMFLLHPLVKLSIVVILRDRELARSASSLQGLNFESCVWRAVSSRSSHHPQEVLLVKFSLYVHKSGLKPDSFLLFTKCFFFAPCEEIKHCEKPM